MANLQKVDSGGGVWHLLKVLSGGVWHLAKACCCITHTCCLQGDCCVSDYSNVRVHFNTDFGEIPSGTEIVLPYLTCDSPERLWAGELIAAALWENSHAEHPPFGGGDFDGATKSYVLRVWFDGGWRLVIYESDLSTTIFDFTLDPKDCCGVTSTYVDITLENNKCCNCEVSATPTCIASTKDYCPADGDGVCDQFTGNELDCDSAP